MFPETLGLFKQGGIRGDIGKLIIAIHWTLGANVLKYLDDCASLGIPTSTTMQISSQYPLVIYSDPYRSQSQSNRQASAQQPEATVAPLDAAVTGTLSETRVRPTPQAQPSFDQQLSYRGQQARNHYQDVALSGEVDLVNRLDVIV